LSLTLDEKYPEKIFYKWEPSFTLKLVLWGWVRPNPNYKMVSKSIKYFLRHPLWGHLGHALDVQSSVWGVCGESPTLNEMWPQKVFIMEMHHSPNKQFYEAGLGLTQILWVCLDGSFWRRGEGRTYFLFLN
jgi:hypothetical protein